MTGALRITPETRIGELLDAYPALERTLLDASPAFAKLKNPVLRRTVAKLATVEQAARIAGLAPDRLVRELRVAAGQEVECQPAVHVRQQPDAVSERPAWIDTSPTAQVIDAEALLAQGVHPLGIVRREIASVASGEMLCLDSTFAPVPLAEELGRTGVQTYIETLGPNRYRTYLRRG